MWGNLVEILKVDFISLIGYRLGKMLFKESEDCGFVNGG